MENIKATKCYYCGRLHDLSSETYLVFTGMVEVNGAVVFDLDEDAAFCKICLPIYIKYVFFDYAS